MKKQKLHVTVVVTSCRLTSEEPPPIDLRVVSFKKATNHNLKYRCGITQLFEGSYSAVWNGFGTPLGFRRVRVPKGRAGRAWVRNRCWGREMTMCIMGGRGTVTKTWVEH